MSSSKGAAATITAFAAAAAGDDVAAQRSSAAWQHPSVHRGTVAVSTIALSAFVLWRPTRRAAVADEAVATLAGWHKMWALTIRACIALAGGGDHERAQQRCLRILSIGVCNGSRLGLPHTLDCLAS